jgi:hypothetical protein
MASEGHSEPRRAATVERLGRAQVAGAAAGDETRAPEQPGAASADRRPCRADTRVRLHRPGAILSAMSTESDRIPAKPTLDGLEDKWTQRWAKERVVQV